MAIIYTSAEEIKGNIIQIKSEESFFGEKVIIEQDGIIKNGQVIAIDNDLVYIQVFEGTFGFSLNNIRVRLTKEPFLLNLSPDIVGRVFDGLGRPIDGLGEIYGGVRKNINTPAINPIFRDYPKGFVQTGISSIDLLITLVRGQKLPIFSVEGIFHDKLAIQIVSQSKIYENNEFYESTSVLENDKYPIDEDNYIVFAGIGLKFDTYNFFKNSFMEIGNTNIVTFLNLALSPVSERLLIPRVALTAAEYLAFDLGKNVIVIMTDMTSYCEAMRELSATRGEIPGRKGYPSYMYSDLSSIYERAGIIKGKRGSLTLIPILTMPAGDITHPIADLTGFITEGQIVLSNNFKYPHISILPSLSRLMKDAIGSGKTTKEHPVIAKKIFEAYSKVGYARDLAQIIGEDELSNEDKLYIKFGMEFENVLLKQDYTENRSIYSTISIAKELLRIIEDE
ncbi:MAG: V-type ATP synthase subunit B [Defluviitaleaceae bacterium]|nr:V-type ATP synthase subunit B [Defluviitaleaceae bacterium]